MIKPSCGLRVSVILTMKDEEKYISRCLESLLDQTLQDYEVIVVDDYSTDSSLKIVQKYQSTYSTKIRYLSLENPVHPPGPGYARNIASKQAKGDILVFLDADMYFAKDFLEQIVKPILTGEALGTHHGWEYVANSENPWVRCEGVKIRFAPSRSEKSFYRAILRDLFIEKGGFDYSWGYFDDRTLYKKIGVKAKIASEAICYHNSPDSLAEIFRIRRWRGETVFISLKTRSEFFWVLITTIALISEFMMPFLILITLFLPVLPFIIITSLSLLEFIYAVAKQNYLKENKGVLDVIKYRLIYIPIFRWVRAAGHIAGILTYIKTILKNSIK